MLFNQHPIFIFPTINHSHFRISGTPTENVWIAHKLHLTLNLGQNVGID